ncbi:MAG: DUF551 domain-containing protein, partial [Parabacteroides gordonii]|nr:DUF551 domain-containing protein [Parabacteroides gordonii]
RKDMFTLDGDEVRFDSIDIGSARYVAFKAGAEWQSKQMAWISVNEKMPEDGHIIDDLTVYSHTKNVIVLYKNGCIGKGKRIFTNDTNKSGWQWSCFKGEDITHWMYLPE